MRGEVLHYDEAQGFGFITGADGNRYTFRREDLRRDVAIGRGAEVDFQAENGKATGVFPIRASQAAPAAALPAAAGPRQFGRNAVAGATPVAQASTGLWGYFRRAITSNYADFSGRARRKEYWGYALFWIIVMFVLCLAGILADAAIGSFDSGDMPVVTVVVMSVWVLAMVVPSIAVSVRRQHDIGLSGWFFLLGFLPYVGQLILFVFAVIPSQKHGNKWGPVPPGIQPSAPDANQPAPGLPR